MFFFLFFFLFLQKRFNFSHLGNVGKFELVADREEDVYNETGRFETPQITHKVDHCGAFDFASKYCREVSAASVITKKTLVLIRFNEGLTKLLRG